MGGLERCEKKNDDNAQLRELADQHLAVPALTDGSTIAFVGLLLAASEAVDLVVRGQYANAFVVSSACTSCNMDCPLKSHESRGADKDEIEEEERTALQVALVRAVALHVRIHQPHVKRIAVVGLFHSSCITKTQVSPTPQPCNVELRGWDSSLRCR